MRVDGIDNVERCETSRQQFVRIDVDHDLAIFAAGGRRQSDARHRSELLPHTIDAVVIELLFVQPIRTEAELQNGNTRRIELHDDWWLNARRHQRTDRIGRRNDLGDREVQVDVRLEVDLLNGQPIQRLRFHVLDAVDVGADRILAVGSDALLHLGRA